MKFKHFIITRFNTSLMSEPVYLDRQGENKRYDPTWLAERVSLFEKVCSPTIRKQTNHNFQWLVLFGDNTSPEFIDTLRKKHKFIPVIGSQWRLYENLNLTIKRMKEDATFIITTNVDSDDGISKAYVAEIKDQFKEREMAIYVDNGVRWSLKDDTYISTAGSRNPFPSIVEPITDGSVRTVIAYSHGQLDGYYGTVVHINNKTTRWLMGIHDGNLVNRMNYTSQDKPKPFKDIADLFGLLP